MKKNKEILKEKPNLDDFDYKPYGYINALHKYIDKLEKAIKYTLCSTELLDFEQWRKMQAPLPDTAAWETLEEYFKWCYGSDLNHKQ